MATPTDSPNRRRYSSTSARELMVPVSCLAWARLGKSRPQPYHRDRSPTTGTAALPLETAALPPGRGLEASRLPRAHLSRPERAQLGLALRRRHVEARGGRSRGGGRGGGGGLGGRGSRALHRLG